MTRITPTVGSSFVATNFGGFGELAVRSGLGADTIDLATLDSASTLTAVTLAAIASRTAIQRTTFCRSRARLG